MDETARIETLIRELDAQKDAYLDALQKTHDRLTQNLAASSARSIGARSIHRPANSVSNSERETESRVSTAVAPVSVQASSFSKSTGDESDGEDENLYVQEPLEPESYDEDGLRNHLKSFRFSEQSRKVLHGVLDDPARLTQVPLLPNRPGPYDDRSHYTHSQIFDVGSDGSPLLVDNSNIETTSGRAMGLWHAIKDVNHPSKERKAVGRITIVREPSPILFATLHYTMHNAFDVEELFRHLFDAEDTSTRMFRAFEDSELRRRTFVFNFEYFTLIGPDCVPMKWQMCAGQEDRKPGYIQITRCSSVIALSLSGAPIKEMKNPSRRKRSPKDKGAVYDPFAPWKVLNIQCYPDWKATLDVHDSTKHYVNGPDAFLNTILGEFRDAARRFDNIQKRIWKQVKSAHEFIFNSSLREPLLFEDDEYSIVKRYFWAHQTLGIMNESMQAMVDAFEDNFTGDVWEGKHPTLWPLLDENSARNTHFKKKLASLKAELGREVENLKKLIDENEERQEDINDLREWLFAGTSIKESRTTIHQGQNIKLLTLVSIFFLPLTFVTSVFGMTNMPTAHHYWMFGIVICTICIPFFVLIGWLNTNQGIRFSRNLPYWRLRARMAIGRFGRFVSSPFRRHGDDTELVPMKSVDSQASGVSMRRWSSSQRVGRHVGLEEPGTREDGQMGRDDALKRSRTFSEQRTESVSSEHPSALVKMLRGENKRRLRYSENV